MRWTISLLFTQSDLSGSGRTADLHAASVTAVSHQQMAESTHVCSHIYLQPASAVVELIRIDWNRLLYENVFLFCSTTESCVYFILIIALLLYLWSSVTLYVHSALYLGLLY